MTRRFLGETALDGFRVLSVGQHRVYDSWDQVNAYLQATLGPSHAALFAEPRTGAGVTAWTATTEAEPVPLASLDDAARQAALARLGSLIDDISADADAKAASSKMEDQRWAALLRAILTLPQSRDIGEFLYVADGQPVLVQWGTRDENRMEETGALRDRIEKAIVAPVRRAVPPPPGPVEGPGDATLVSAPAAAAATGRGWPWWLLIWLLFLALVAAIYWRLLLACVVSLPGVSVGTCEVPVAVAGPAAPAAERDALERTLRSLRAGLAQAPQCEVRTALLPPAAVVPQTAPAPEPEPEAEPEETAIDRAREQAGGQVGDVTLTLLWNGRSDLDLMVHCPDGSTLAGWSPPVCGGEIDVDANRCDRRDGLICAEYRGTPVQNPVENGFFMRGDAIPGTYRVEVRNYAAERAAPGTQVPFALQVRQGDSVEVLRGSLVEGESSMMATFTIE